MIRIFLSHLSVLEKCAMNAIIDVRKLMWPFIDSLQDFETSIAVPSFHTHLTCPALPIGDLLRCKQALGRWLITQWIISKDSAFLSSGKDPQTIAYTFELNMYGAKVWLQGQYFCVHDLRTDSHAALSMVDAKKLFDSSNAINPADPPATVETLVRVMNQILLESSPSYHKHLEVIAFVDKVVKELFNKGKNITRLHITLLSGETIPEDVKKEDLIFAVLDLMQATHSSGAYIGTHAQASVKDSWLASLHARLSPRETLILEGNENRQ